MSEDAEQSWQLPPFWSPGANKPARKERPAPPPLTLDGVMQTLQGALGSQLRSVPQLVRAFGSMLLPGEEGDTGLRLPAQTLALGQGDAHRRAALDALAKF